MRYNVAKLSNSTIMAAYNLEIANRFANIAALSLQEEDKAPAELFTHLKEVSTRAAYEVHGEAPKLTNISSVTYRKLTLMEKQNKLERHRDHSKAKEENADN